MTLFELLALPLLGLIPVVMVAWAVASSLPMGVSGRAIPDVRNRTCRNKGAAIPRKRMGAPSQAPFPRMEKL